MTDIDTSLAEAGDALRALADGPGKEAADALEAAFGRAGKTIEASLAQAARSGELNFQRMAEGVLRDLGRIAAEAVLAQTGLAGGGGQSGAPLNLTMNVAQGGRAPSVGSVASAVALAAVRGGRFL